MRKSVPKFAFKSLQVSPVLAKQIHASKTFFVSQLPSFECYPLAEIDISSDIKRFKGPKYNIGGFDGQEVVSVLSGIVSDDEQFKTNKTFYLLIQGNPEDDLEELFRVQARPTKHQPGNAVVFLRPRGKKTFKRGSAKSYEELNGALKAHYKTDTKQFAADIKQLLKNNEQFEGLPQATTEAYMLLLFEIARRLVKSENPSDKKEAFDILPIGSAIARLIQLLERGDEKTCIFEDVFLPGGRFHCFTGTPEQRERAIENINAAIFGTTKQETVTEEDCLEALEQLFCSDERLAKKLSKEEQVEEKMKALVVAPGVLPPVLFQPSDIEGYTAYDYFEE